MPIKKVRELFKIFEKKSKLDTLSSRCDYVIHRKQHKNYSAL